MTMNQIFANSLTIGVVLSIAIFQLALQIQKKWKHPLLNPIIVTTTIIIIFLCVFDVEYENYYSSAKYLEYLLTPTTVCLSIPLYEKIQILKEHYKAILLGVTSGIVAGMATILAFTFLFGLSYEQYATLLPKSVTTAIAIGVSEELGGIVSLTIAAVIITGVLGNAMAEKVCTLFRIKHPVAVGVAIGTSSHALGTTKAMELGKIEGAMSSLAIVVAGLVTTIGASIFISFY